MVAATASLSAVKRLMKPLRPESLLEGHAHAELKVPVAASALRDVKAQADEREVHVGAAADAEVERLVGELLPVRIRRTVVGEDLHAEAADRKGRRQRNAQFGRRGGEVVVGLVAGVEAAQARRAAQQVVLVGRQRLIRRDREPAQRQYRAAEQAEIAARVYGVAVRLPGVELQPFPAKFRMH